MTQFSSVLIKKAWKRAVNFCEQSETQILAEQMEQQIRKTEIEKVIAVGLTVAQIESLADIFAVMYSVPTTLFIRRYRDWELSQTFAQPVEFSNVELADSYQALYEDHEQLKTRVISHDWRDAPKWANWLAQNKDGMWTWFEHVPVVNMTRLEWQNRWDHENGMFSEIRSNGYDWTVSLQQRPKQVDSHDVIIGQLYVNRETYKTYKISAIDESEFGSICIQEVNKETRVAGKLHLVPRDYISGLELVS